MHQIPVDTIIVYIKINTIAIITLKSIKCYIVLGGVLLFFLCFYLFCKENYNGTTFTELLNFTEKICYFFIHKKRLGYVRNPRSLMEETETLCRDDIGDLPGSPEHL